MYYKVRIKSLPKAKVGYQVNGSLANDISSIGGKDVDLKDHSNIKVTKSITAVPRKDANLEAEGGETVIGNIDGSKIPSFFNIEGPRHSSGGVPLNLPDDSFIFSDTKSMMITDPTLLKIFNMPKKKGGYTPAEMSKKFDINKYREILQNRNSDKLDIKTAEMMIKNYVMKLGALALAQEAKKGFPQGIPKLSRPYMEASGIAEEDLIPKENKKEMQQPGQEQNAIDSDKKAPTNMPNGEPVAKPQEEMMRYGGGIRRLKRAQEGMQQPSEEEMMVMQQQQAQQQQQQQGGQDQQMMQIMQQVAEALQQGAKPEELTVELLQGQVPPEAIAQIFVKLGMPQDQVQQLIIGVIQQMQSVQEQDPRQQMDPRQQQQISEEEMMAMQQQDPRQMQQAPMAAYGMEMGGYDMPFYYDPYEMGYGGLYKARDGITVNNIPSTAVKKFSEGLEWKPGQTNTGLQGQYAKVYGEDVKFHSGRGGGSEEGVASGVCKKLGKSHNVEQVIRDVFPAYLRKNGWSGDKNGPSDSKSSTYEKDKETYQTALMKSVEQLRSNPLYTECVEAAIKNSTKAEHIDNETTDKCYCKDAAGNLITKNGQTIELGRDANGNCLTDDPKCHEEKTSCVPGSEEYIAKEKECTTAGKKFDGPNCKCVDTVEGCTPGTDVYNNAKAICDQKGEEFDPSICNCKSTPTERDPEWWLQDTVNTMGAASDLASVKKYMPWEARVDLEEPRPTFLDPTRELGQQSEQANIAAQASASFAGPQGLGARNAATQGVAANQAANTLSNINNQNVNIANQFEGTQIGIRNQESMLNQQMANRVYDKNTIANQQFDNSKMAGRQNLRNSYNKAVTNKWKTDAFNQMYENYQTRPGVGGRVIYTPTDKTLDTTKRKDLYAAAEEHCKEEKGSAKQKCMETYLKYHAQYGGETFEYGGYVYTVYPNY